MAAGLQFIAFQPEHRQGCLRLFDDNCPEYFAPNERGDYESFLAACPRHYRIGIAGDAVRAAFGMSDGTAPGRVRLSWILVARDAQRSGLGAAMMQDAEAFARVRGSHTIEIAASHKSAAFFARFGARAFRTLENGWGPDMHRVDMEWRLDPTLLTGEGGRVVLPTFTLVDRADGGHLIVNPPRDVWERSELTRDELLHWSLLVAATGRAMIDVLPQLSAGCVNYWEAGNWALHDEAPPRGRKDARQHRRVHLHLLGRSPTARHPAWQWGEAPRFPPYRDREAWASSFAPLTADECDAVAQRARELLADKFRLA